MKKIITYNNSHNHRGNRFGCFKSKTNAPTTETTNAPTTQLQVDDAEINAINKDIESINVGSSDQEFNDVNKDLQGL